VRDVALMKPIRPVEVSPLEVGGSSGSAGPIAEELMDSQMADDGKRAPRKIADPRLPSADEIAEHEMTHLPYRSWCSHCVRGKGRTMDHRKTKDEHLLKEVHVDYCFMGGANDDKTNTIVVAKEYGSRMVMASVVPMKGMSHEFPGKRIGAFLKELGLEHVDVVLKGDQEPALQDLLREIARIRAPAKTFFEQSAVGSSQSNGMIERGILTVEGQIRVMKDALETRLEEKIPGEHAVLAWLVEFAAVLVNRYEVGHDGKTAYERLRGKKSKLLGLEFGERLNYKRNRSGNKLAKLDCMWEDGMFLGYRSNSGEIIIGTEEG
jgi:hypothetical protein